VSSLRRDNGRGNCLLIAEGFFHARAQKFIFAIRAGWLRAAVLGANDGIISAASLVVGRSIRSLVRWQL
jgi:hypothetical protein